MNLQGWSWDLNLEVLSQQLQDNFQKAQELVNQYSLDHLQDDPLPKAHDETSSGDESSMSIEHFAPSHPREIRVEARAASHTIEPVTAGGSPIEVGQLVPGPIRMSDGSVNSTQSIPRLSESNGASSSPKVFFGDDSDLDLENDPILHRSRQRQTATAKTADRQHIVSRPPDVDLEMGKRTVTQADTPTKPQAIGLSVFDKLTSSSSTGVQGVVQKLATRASSSAYSLARRCTTVHKFYVAGVCKLPSVATLL